MSPPPPRNDPDWASRTAERIRVELERVSIHTTAPPKEMKSWARASVWSVESDAGVIWVKYAYRLPPGEERVVVPLARRHPGRVPEVVAVWPGAFAARTIPGRELNEDDDVDEWERASAAVGALCAAEADHIEEWLELGVRDRRMSAWRASVEALASSTVLHTLSAAERDVLETKWEEWIRRYEEAFSAPPTLVHQDSGCCNIHLTADGPVLFDWTDVVVGHSAFSCDRLLDQVPRERHARVIDAFCEAAEIEQDELKAMRRSNVLHEVLRYHDELPYIAPRDPVYASLSASVCNQLRVLLAHESK